jgi:hypothetical protein
MYGHIHMALHFPADSALGKAFLDEDDNKRLTAAACGVSLILCLQARDVAQGAHSCILRRECSTRRTLVHFATRNAAQGARSCILQRAMQHKAHAHAFCNAHAAQGARTCILQRACSTRCTFVHFATQTSAGNSILSVWVK